MLIKRLILFVCLLIIPFLTFAQSGEKQQKKYDKKKERQLADVEKAEKDAIKAHFKKQQRHVRKRMKKSRREAKRYNKREHKWYNKWWYNLTKKKKRVNR